MAEGRNYVRPVITLLLIGVTITGFINVFSDNSEVIAKAQTAACGTPTCAYQMTRQARNPIMQSFTFQTVLTERRNINQQMAVDVDCHRSLYLVGEYSCEREGGGGPPLAPSR
jgi:hypothetical protein